MSPPSPTMRKTITFTEVIEQPIQPISAPAASALADLTGALRTYTSVEIATHSTPSSLWVVIGDEVYDVTNFQHEHPGGAKRTFEWEPRNMFTPKCTYSHAVLQKVAGTDATVKFRKYHRDGLLVRFRESLQIGTVVASESSGAIDKRRKRWMVWKK